MDMGIIFFLLVNQNCPMGCSLLKKTFMSLSLVRTHNVTTTSGCKQFKRAKIRQCLIFIKLLVSTGISE